MAYGDGIKGIIRNLKYNIRTKAWKDTAGMLVLCIIIGAKMGFAGIFAGIVCSFIERIENLDDNITVPASGLFILLAAYYYFPSLTASFYRFFSANFLTCLLYSICLVFILFCFFILPFRFFILPFRFQLPIYIFFLNSDFLKFVCNLRVA